MAQKTLVQYFSDLSGAEVDPADATVRFALDGTSYEIDLTPKERDKLRSVLAPYVEAARKSKVETRRARPTGTASGSAPSAREIREWGRANGHVVPERGRIPALVREAYDAAHSPPPAISRQ